MASGSCAFAASDGQAAVGFCRRDTSETLAGLGHIYRRDEFRIIYATDGEHALASTTDRNDNGIPDRVEDVATQLVAAREIYSDIIGLTHPLDMPRYARVESIDIFLLNLKRGNGLAYDEAINYRLPFDGVDGRCILRIDVRNSLSNQNVTPAHELFHLYQYAYSMFKARWFLEGTARWAEYALRPGAGPQHPLPASKQGIQQQVFSQTYGANGLWNRLAAIADPVGRLPLTGPLMRAKYVDGSAVVHDDVLHGASFMVALFEELDSLSANVSSRHGWNRYNWKEADQKSASHNAEMLGSVVQAARHGITDDMPRGGEFGNFFAVASAASMLDR